MTHPGQPESTPEQRELKHLSIVPENKSTETPRVVVSENEINEPVGSLDPSGRGGPTR